MNARRWVLLAGAVAVALCCSTAGWCQPTPRAWLWVKKGEVKIQRGGRGHWLQVPKGRPRHLYAGDHVQTYHRAYAVVLINGARAALAPRTHIVIPPVSPKKTPGRIWTVAGKVFLWLIGTRTIELGTEGAIASAEGTRFLIEVEPGGVTRLTVLEGTVRFHNELGSVLVGANEQSVADPASAPSRPSRVDPSGYIEWEATLDNVWLGLEILYNPSETRERLTELATEAKRAAEASPADVAAQLRAGDSLQDAGDLSGAEEAYRKALEITPGDVEAQLRLGFNLLLQARREEAQEVFAAAAKAAPDRADPLVGQAAAMASSLREESLAQAEGYLSKAFAIEPNNALAHVVAGIVAMRTGDAEKAAQAFRRAIELAPSTYQAHAYLSAVQLAQGDTAAALAAAQKAIELAPASGLARESLATVSFFAGDLEAARRDIDIALEANPNSATAHLLSSDVYVAEGDLDEGLREAQLSVALDPLLAPAYSALGMILLAENDLKSADKAFSKALELGPKLIAARTGLGVTYARQGKIGAAMEMQKAAIALDSKRASTLNNLGAIHLALGHLDQAIAGFEAAMESQPEWAMPHANLAIAYLDLNRFADAVREGELAVRLGEDSARVHTTLARVYLEQNRTNKAWASLRRALELDENYALAHLQMAEVYQRQGRSRDALKHQLEGITLQPSAMLETREYSRTEVTASAGGGGGAADIKADGRGDEGQNSYYADIAHERDDWDRAHSDWERTTVLGIAGRQTSADRTDALYFSAQREDRDKPGKLLNGAPEDTDYQSRFRGRELHYFGRRRVTEGGEVTFRAGYRRSVLYDYNPDSFMPDPKPFRGLKIEYDGPLAEARLDQALSPRSKVVAGVAVSGEERTVSGVLGTPNPPGAQDPVTWTAFSDDENREAATFYAEYETQAGASDKVMVGGRLATRKGMNPVFRPKGYWKHDLGKHATLVLLTRPILRDDVSEISPVDNWALRDWLSPLDLAMGGFSQSYELQYQLMPPDGSLLRLSGFYRTLKNYIVDLADPRWSAGEAGMVLASGTLKGGEIEWEHWVGRDLTAGIWLRYTDSENDDAGGLEIPYQPEVAGQLRLDYMDERGVRVGVGWLHAGERYADIANQTRLESYNVLNLWAGKQLNLRTDLFITMENLLCEDYGYYEDYPARGRRLRAGVQYRF